MVTLFISGQRPSAFQDTGGFDPVRDSLSVGFSMLFYIGYGLILAAVMGMAIQRNHTPDLPRAVIWGLAGYAVFHLAPAFSLPPEVPGVAAADVTARQIWCSEQPLTGDRPVAAGF